MRSQGRKGGKAEKKKGKTDGMKAGEQNAGRKVHSVCNPETYFALKGAEGTRVELLAFQYSVCENIISLISVCKSWQCAVLICF